MRQSETASWRGGSSGRPKCLPAWSTRVSFPVHDVGTLQDGRVFYTMKFVEGQRLDKHIQALPSVADRLRLFLRVCDAIAFAHARGVVHRDIKPANIMIGPFGEVLVLDWGLAKVLRQLTGPNDRAD